MMDRETCATRNGTGLAGHPSSGWLRCFPQYEADDLDARIAEARKAMLAAEPDGDAQAMRLWARLAKQRWASGEWKGYTSDKTQV